MRRKDLPIPASGGIRLHIDVTRVGYYVHNSQKCPECTECTPGGAAIKSSTQSDTHM